MAGILAPVVVEFHCVLASLPRDASSFKSLIIFRRSSPQSFDVTGMERDISLAYSFLSAGRMASRLFWDNS